MTSFGYFLSSEELTPRELVATAQEAERAGFDKVWISDHFHPWNQAQGQSPFVWSVLGALAATTDLHLTTAVTCPTFRTHPAVIAQATATVAAMAPGRFTFGVGSGEALNEHVLGEAWPPVSIRHERLREAVELIRALWTGDVVTHQGRYYTVHDARLFTLPETPPQVLVSAFGPKACRLAAEIGDGWMTTSPDSEGMAAYRSAGGTGTTQAGVKVCWATEEDEAVQTAHRLWGHQAASGQTSQDLPMWMGFEGIRDAVPPSATQERVPCGPDPHRAADAIRAYLDVGFDEIYLGQMGTDQVGGIRFLTDEVLPLL